MIPVSCPDHLCGNSLLCFEQVRDWVLQQRRELGRPLLLGIGGPGGSGKSTLSRWLRHHVPEARILSLDDFRLPRQERPQGRPFGSHPEANDLPALCRELKRFREEGAVTQPVFDARSGQVSERISLSGIDLLIADGELAAHQELWDEWDRLILVESHWRTQLNTRLTRDMRDRGCDLEKAMHIFLQSNLRDYPEHSQGVEERADLRIYCTAKHVFRWKG